MEYRDDMTEAEKKEAIADLILEDGSFPPDFPPIDNLRDKLLALPMDALEKVWTASMNYLTEWPMCDDTESVTAIARQVGLIKE